MGNLLQRAALGLVISLFCLSATAKNTSLPLFAKQAVFTPRSTNQLQEILHRGGFKAILINTYQEVFILFNNEREVAALSAYLKKRNIRGYSWVLGISKKSVRKNLVVAVNGEPTKAAVKDSLRHYCQKHKNLHAVFLYEDERKNNFEAYISLRSPVIKARKGYVIGIMCRPTTNRV
jgi:hypothetical protein